MPPGKQQQSNAMLYTMITFVALFIIAATCAVIFYVKAEDYRTAKVDADRRLQALANPSEQGKISSIVGKTPSGQSAFGTLAAHVNTLVSVITGQSTESLADIAASEKVNNTNVDINKTLATLGADAALIGGQTEPVALLKQIEALHASVNQLREENRSLAAQLNDVQTNADLLAERARRREEQLMQEMARYQQRFNEVQAQYDELEALMKQSTDEQVQAVMERLDRAREQISEKNAQLEAMQARLEDTEQQLKDALAKLNEWGRFNKEVAALQPDARIIRIDDQLGVVYLNVGSDDHVYVGLTFGVYDRNAPLPEDGKGKAEIEVFKVEKNLSMAKINRVSKKNPIVPEDVVANLVWDSQTSNQFVVAGLFDFDRDGFHDEEGAVRIRELIERWGGRVVDTVTVNTDFVVLGDAPEPMEQPKPEELEADPSLARRVQAAADAAKAYQEVIDRAERLSVPVLNQTRFLHLIGYESLAAKSTPF